MNTDYITAIRQNLLQDRLGGLLLDPQDVLEIVRKHQPLHGLSNSDWIGITDFILVIEKANNIPAAKKVADEYGLTLEI